MRRANTLSGSLCSPTTLLVSMAGANVAEAGLVSDKFAVGDVIAGSFRYDLTEGPADITADPTSGEYEFKKNTSFLRISIGDHTFSTGVPTDLRVVVTDGTFQGNSDFIQVIGRGNEVSCSPFLSWLSRQSPALEPRCGILINFHFPHTHLASDALPAVIDPAATVGPIPGSSFPPIYGQIEGVSMQQQPIRGLREWALFFEVEPSDVVIINNVVSGTFTGRLTGIDDQTQSLTPAQMLDGLLAQAIGVGPGKVLARRAELAQTYYASGDVVATCANLSDFTDQVVRHSGKKIATFRRSEVACRNAGNYGNDCLRIG